MSVSDYLRRLDEINNNSLNLHQFIKDFQKFEKTFIETCKTFHDEKYDKIYTLDGLCESSLSRIEARQVKINNIREILNKCEISVTFVGGVSCGKSKIINSVLEEEVLPSSIGVTTTKIVKLIGSNEGKYYIKHPDRQFKDKESLYEEVMNVSTDELDEKGGESLIEVVISNPNKPILNDKTFLIDTPGYNANDRSKELVMETCQRSDVIVFVMTYVFSDEEKEMFKLISQKTSKLNLFILVNKWDESDSDESFTVEMSKNSIERRLVDWFQANNDTDKGRIFFISAMEQMDSFREPEKEANEFRRKEFQRFIEGLELSLSDPKFCKCLKHEQDIIAMETDMKTDFDNTTKALSEIINVRSRSIIELKKVLDFLNEEQSKIEKSLTYEKGVILLEIKRHKKSNSSGKILEFFSTPNSKTKKDSEILKMDKMVFKFDHILNDLEQQFWENVEKVINILQGPQLAEKNLPKLKFQSVDSSPARDASKGSLDHKKKPPSALEIQVSTVFNDFKKTIAIRYEMMRSKTVEFFAAIEKVTNGLKITKEKFPILKNIE